jgi:hypothetical protein
MPKKQFFGSLYLRVTCIFLACDTIIIFANTEQILCFSDFSGIFFSLIEEQFNMDDLGACMLPF